jgi:two-component sensor histidine kinase
MPFGTPLTEPSEVLYIEDDYALARLVSRAFERRGHSITHVETGAEALASLSSRSFDVVALDHSRAADTGFDVLSLLGPRSERPPVIYVTAESDARLAIDAIKRGADDYVVKDVSGEFLDLLVLAAEQSVERAKLRRQKIEAERMIREARDRAELLLKEVNHRVANSLGLVASVVRLQANALKDHPEAVQALQETQARIAAVAGVHRHLYTSDTVGTVRLEDYLSQLACDLASSLSNDGLRQIKTDWQMRVTVSTDTAVTLGVIICELITNACKYAYPEGVPGNILIRTVPGANPGELEISVIDWGVGFDVDGPVNGTGLGARITTALAASLKARIGYKRTARGTEAVLFLPNGIQGS